MASAVFSKEPAETIRAAQDAFSRGDRSIAIEMLEESGRRLGRNAQTSRLLSDMHFFAGDYDDALASINDAIVLSTRVSKEVPQDHLLQKATVLTRMGQTERAVELLRAIPAQNRKSAFFRTLRGTIKTRSDTAIYETIASPNFFRSGMPCISALNNYAILLRETGEHRASLLVARERFLKARETLLFGQTPKPMIKPGWAAEASACLSDLRQEFERSGVQFFLISGTFLGAYRESDILGHDKDIDVGVDESVSLDTLHNLFEASTCFVVRDISSTRSLYLRHANGVEVDVFAHYMEDGRYWHEGQKVRWWNSPFDLADIEFLGGTYKVPANADQYLTENYGQWKTPVADFETFIDTPNMEITNRDYILWYFTTKLTDYYLLGRKLQFSRVWKALDAMMPLDKELRTVVLDVLDQADAMLASVQSARTFRRRLQAAMSDGPAQFTRRMGRFALRSMRS